MTKFQLSPIQQQVVNHGEGALIVEAGPGSGKTRVLTERVRRLLTEVPGHFRVLALTFTNKAANEMAERLADLGKVRERATISTLHGFCLEMLRDRGKPIGVVGDPQIFELTKDRKQILLEAAMSDPMLSHELEEADGRQGGRSKLLDQWLALIASVKGHPLSSREDEPIVQCIVETYDAALRACGAYDFDDLLLLAYELLTTFPKVADLYRRLYGYICIDEAQDLNEAQYAVLVALCGDTFRNVMMVGDPKQSIYGFNASSPEYMQKFYKEFNAISIKMNDNFRSSQAVVNAARALNEDYSIVGQSPIQGEIKLGAGSDEASEAKIVCDKLQQLLANGHPDVENGITSSQCAVLGRNRYTLIHIEKELKERGISFYKRLSSNHEYESSLVQEFHLALRICANPRDRLHLNALTKAWGVSAPDLLPTDLQEVIAVLRHLATQSGKSRNEVIVDAIQQSVSVEKQEINLRIGLDILCREYAAHLEGENEKEERRAVYDDTEVLLQEWDQYLRSGKGKTISGFMSSMALGITRQTKNDGVALLTVHSSKGLEFDVVFIVGMADGVFPDYRSRANPKDASEEKRNAFVAVTRSKRLLYLSYPKSRLMVWGETWSSKPSPYMDLLKSI